MPQNRIEPKLQTEREKREGKTGRRTNDQTDGPTDGQGDTETVRAGGDRREGGSNCPRSLATVAYRVAWRGMVHSVAAACGTN